MKVIVLHASYGCDTGCCGHVVHIDDEPCGGFQFAHPGGGYNGIPVESREDFVKRIVTEAVGEEHVKDIDWDNCIVIDD